VLGRFLEYAELLGSAETEVREVVELGGGRVLFVERLPRRRRGEA
jgi:hypothetical protein